ncbi:MAG: hypothetical protein ABIO36_06020, partial [Pyrinomonadaceae bacterium]
MPFNLDEVFNFRMFNSSTVHFPLNFMRFAAIAAFLISTILLTNVAIQSQTTVLAAKKDDPLKNLQYRSIGPFRGGRSGAVEGIASQPNVYYYGSAGGGVWKTTDAGANWLNISDGFFKTGSVGAIDVADSD